MRFVTDRIVRGRAYPALAQHEARPYTQSWREFGQHWPYTVPAELFGHMDDHAFEYQLDTQGHGWYVIGLGFFDFTIDYFARLPTDIIGRIRSQRVRILFYYHEGDNPCNIKQRLDYLCDIHNFDPGCYRFVSGNTQADSLPGFAWFPDHELLYWRRNRGHSPVQQILNFRPYEFLALNRTHKWWRATAMADLVQRGLLDRSLWSYNTEISTGEPRTDNPIEESYFNQIDVDKFISHTPYTCDNLTSAQHNDHSFLVPEHYTQTYCSIILETHFDADGSGGAFLTEKTFKAIKHGHPFVIVGTPHSLATLRNLGYKTFDHAINNLYDTEENNTRRWQLIRYAIESIQEHNMQQWYESCWADIQHNQQLFLEHKHDRLSKLFTRLGKI